MIRPPPSPWAVRWRNLRALAWPLAGYWGMLVVGMALFAAVILLQEGLTEENLMILAVLDIASAFGVAFGQACALTRLRLPMVLLAGASVSLATFVAMGATGMSGLEPVAVLLAVLWFLFPFFSVSGLLSLRTSSLQVFSLFAPIVWIVGAILVVAEKAGKVSQWKDGQKWAVWDVVTASMLFVGIALALLYLATRERHRLHGWLTGVRAPEHATTVRQRGNLLGAAASGCGTLAATLFLAVVLTLGVGLLAPFLWRTGPVEGEGSGGGGGEPTEQPAPEPRPKGKDTDGDGVPDKEERKQGTDPRNPDTDGDGMNDGGERHAGTDPKDADTDGDGVQDGAEGSKGTSPKNPDTDGDGEGDATDDDQTDGGKQVQEAMKNAGISLLFLILMVFLALLGLFLFGPPLRRSLLLAALRRPPGAQTPSHRIEHAWRITAIALGDLGIRPLPGDSATAHARRAVAGLPKGLLTAPMTECAEIADRVRYGLGMEPTDEMRARRNAEMAYQAVWQTLSEWQKIRAVYRWEL